MAVSDRHPDLERLAAYTEGRLSAATRADVQGHLAECERCRELIVNAMTSTVDDPGILPARNVRRVPAARWGSVRWVSVAAGLAAAAALVLAVWTMRPAWLGFGPRADRPELQELIAAVAHEPTRPVEGRLTGFTHGPPPIVTRGAGQRELSLDARLIALKIEKAARETNAGGSQATLGIAQLVLGNTDSAIAALRAAVQRSPDDAALLSDLSAAYLERGSRERKEADLAQAVTTAEQAVARDPSRLEARFNRALALERLGRTSEAAAAWSDYIARDPSSPWTVEAQRHAQSRG